MRLGRLPTIRHNARSEASEHAIALVAIPRQDPLHKLTHFGALLVAGASLSQGTISGDCHGATKMVASRNDIVKQKAFVELFL